MPKPGFGASEPSGVLSRYRRLSLGTKILIFLGMGILAGMLLGERARVAQPVGDLFVRLLMMAAIPLVFFNLLAGLTSLPNPKELGRIGGRILSYYLVTTTMAITLGLAVMHLLRPGEGMQLKGEVHESFGSMPSIAEVLLDLVPRNIFEAFGAGNLSQVVVFTVLLGLAALLLGSEKLKALHGIFDLLAELLRKLVELVMHFGPVGIGALAAATVGQFGASIFGPLALFIAGVWGAQSIMVLFYLALLGVLSRRSPLEFLRLTAPLYATTAATCSSLASLAVSLDLAEKRLHLPRSVYSFCLPLGAQINKDGTAIMLAGVLLFTAQAAGVEFGLSAQASVIVVGLLLSTGSGGIPGGGMVISLIFVQAFNLPPEIAVIVSGVYRLIDMGSTTINCMGDLVGTTIVADLSGASKPRGQRRSSVTPP